MFAAPSSPAGGCSARSRRSRAPVPSGGRRRRTGSGAAPADENAGQRSRRQPAPATHPPRAAQHRPPPRTRARVRGAASPTSPWPPAAPARRRVAGSACSRTSPASEQVGAYLVPRAIALSRTIRLAHAALQLAGPGRRPRGVRRPLDAVDELRSELEALCGVELQCRVREGLEAGRHPPIVPHRDRIGGDRGRPATRARAKGCDARSAATSSAARHARPPFPAAARPLRHRQLALVAPPPGTGSHPLPRG